MHTRIYGLENEYRTMHKKGKENIDYMQIIKDSPELTPVLFKDSSPGFAANGARLYVDTIGFIPGRTYKIIEYATPECASVYDLIAHECAGNEIVFEKIHKFVTIMKSSHGWKTGTSGCHENYLIEESIASDQDHLK